jgi:hypothetical protein
VQKSLVFRREGKLIHAAPEALRTVLLELRSDGFKI